MLLTPMGSRRYTYIAPMAHVTRNEVECRDAESVQGQGNSFFNFDGGNRVIQPVKEKIILGIDPGTNVMGYGVLKVVGTKPEVLALGVIDLRKMSDPYLKLGHIFQRVTGIIESYLPDELAIEAPFFGKNVQSMLKLGRAQGVAMAAAISRDIPITEYAPLKIKMAITGNGAASKEQVAGMLQHILNLKDQDLGPFLDATDALGVAYCHYLQMGRPSMGKEYKGWKDFLQKNPERKR